MAKLFNSFGTIKSKWRWIELAAGLPRPLLRTPTILCMEGTAH